MALRRPRRYLTLSYRRYLNIADFDELAEHAMEDIDTTFAPNVAAGRTMLLPAKTSAVVLRASMLLSLSKSKA